MAAGADVNAAQQGGFTPLMAAARSGDADLVAFLRAQGARVGARTEDEGLSAADLAREEGTRRWRTRWSRGRAHFPEGCGRSA
ncbi:hypothetical protein [Deinococcus aquaticus]|uniref:hypothetical protein n=1 Tax=Deinococcus aquaticus TaxID=328692 RepID=UPI0036106E75